MCYDNHHRNFCVEGRKGFGHLEEKKKKWCVNCAKFEGYEVYFRWNQTLIHMRVRLCQLHNDGNAYGMKC